MSGVKGQVPTHPEQLKCQDIPNTRSGFEPYGWGGLEGACPLQLLVEWGRDGQSRGMTQRFGNVVKSCGGCAWVNRIVRWGERLV
jgi:hypothetical protein